MGTVFLPIPVVRSWESYKSQTGNYVCNVFLFFPDDFYNCLQKNGAEEAGHLNSPQPDALAQAVLITTPNCNATVSEENPIVFVNTIIGYNNFRKANKLLGYSS